MRDDDDAQQIIESDEDEEVFESVQQVNSGDLQTTSDQQQQPIDFSRFEVQRHLRIGRGLSKPWRMSLALSGVLSIALSLAAMVCGVATLALANRPYSEQRHFYVVTDFGMIVLLFAGIEALRKSRSQNCELDFGSPTILIVFSALSVVASICNVVTLAVNMNYEDQSSELMLEIFAFIYSLVCLMLSVCQIVIAVKACNFGSRFRFRFTDYNRSTGGNDGIQKWVFLACGLAEILLGVSIGCLIAASDSIRINVVSLFTSEYETAGWLIAIAGTFLIFPMSFSADNRLLYSVTVIQAFALLTAVRFVSTPPARLYTVGSYPENKLSWLLFFLALTAIPILTVGFLNVLKRAFDHDRSVTDQIDIVTRKRWPLYSYIPSVQLALGLLYILLTIIGALEKFLYVTDFTPLPLMLLVYAVLSHRLRRQPDPSMLLANFAWVAVCQLFALRDVYLFDYHAAVPNSPDTPTRYVNATNGDVKIGIHVGTAAIALMALLIGMAATAVYLRTLLDSTVLVFDRILYRWNLRLLQPIAAVQLLCGAIATNLGFVTFLSRSLASEMLGDHAIYVGALVMFASILTLISGRVNNLLPFALVAQILCCFITWQTLDYCSELLSVLLAYSGDFFPNFFIKVAFLSSRRLISMGIIGLALLVIQFICGCVNVMLLSGIVENGEFRSKPTNIEMSSLS